MPEAGIARGQGQCWMWVARALTRPDGYHDEAPALAVRPESKKLFREPHFPVVAGTRPLLAASIMRPLLAASISRLNSKPHTKQRKGFL